jgi:hypothetical protein
MEQQPQLVLVAVLLLLNATAPVDCQAGCPAVCSGPNVTVITPAVREAQNRELRNVYSAW